MLLKNVDTLRFLTIYLMMFAHLDYGSLADSTVAIEDDPNKYFYLLSNSVSIMASPLLGAVAGYFAAHIYARSNYLSLVKKKWRTLIAPFFVWNTMFLVFELLKHYVAHNLLSMDVASKPPDIGNISAFLGQYDFFGKPINYPLHYIQDLFVLNLFLPVFLIFAGRLRAIAPGALLLLLFYLPSDPLGIAPRTDLMVFFGLGVYGFVFRDYLAKLARSRAAAWAALAALLAYGAIIAAYMLPSPTQRSTPLFLGIPSIAVLRVCATICLLWAGSNLPLWRLGVERFVSRADTFRAYCLHAIVISLAWPLMRIIIGNLDNVALSYLLVVIFPAFAFVLAILSNRMQSAVKSHWPAWSGA